jgi:carboxymethylenebutenolidase
MNHFQRYLAEEFAEDYQEGRLTRRQALKLIASVTGSLVLANSFLAACAPPLQATVTQTPTLGTLPTNTPGQSIPPTTEPTTGPTTTEAAVTTESPLPTPPVSGTVSPDDPAVEAGPAQFPGEGATLLGYLARPTGDGPFAVVLVCHENRGLTPHIQDVTRRLAKAGYVGLAVDLLSRQGGTEAVGSDNVPGALGNISPDQFVQDFLSGWAHTQTLPFADAERVGMVGFCFGGGVTWSMATHMPELKAAVPFYGPHPPVAEVPNINAAVLAIYAERDQRINQGISAIEAAMQEHGKLYEKVIYPDSDHAFHNDTGSRYNSEAAQDAWARTLAWFERYLAA